MSRILHNSRLCQCGQFVLALVVASCGASCGDSPSAPTTPTTPTPTQDAPTVTAVEPSSGSSDGGTEVIITGTGFIGVTTLIFGSNPALSFAVNSETMITATAPAGSLETVDVVVTTPGGGSATSDADRFTWLPNVLMNLTLSESVVRSGSRVRGTVTLAYPAPSVGLKLPLKWQSTPPDSTAILAPAHVVVPAGSTEGSFEITTFYVSSEEQIEVTSEHWGERGATFRLRP